MGAQGPVHFVYIAPKTEMASSLPKVNRHTTIDVLDIIDRKERIIPASNTEVLFESVDTYYTGNIISSALQ